jgi:hypothetical protein
LSTGAIEYVAAYAPFLDEPEQRPELIRQLA